VPSFKPAYLICGDDHGRIAERRARLRMIAERESGASGAEVLEGDGATPELLAAALSTMTFALGRRFVIVDGVERWKDREVTELLQGPLADIPPDTTVALFAREEGRLRAPASLRAAVEAAGGEISEEAKVKPWELPKWVCAQARHLGLGLDLDAARALIGLVGERQQRLVRELEKLALDLGYGGRVTVELVEELASTSSERRVWSLADALVARDRAAATRLYLALDGQGERLPGMVHWIAQRLRTALDVAGRLEQGESPAELRRSLRMPRAAAERFVEDVRGTDPPSLRRALEALAELELDSRGSSPLEERTSVLRAIAVIAA
jgi:DNA polymerase-3 subunit delta